MLWVLTFYIKGPKTVVWNPFDFRSCRQFLVWVHLLKLSLKSSTAAEHHHHRVFLQSSTSMIWLSHSHSHRYNYTFPYTSSPYQTSSFISWIHFCIRVSSKFLSFFCFLWIWVWIGFRLKLICKGFLSLFSSASSSFFVT